METIESTDRYGGHLPDPETVCEGPCEGMGMYPAYDPAFDVREGPHLCQPVADPEDVAAIKASGKTPGPDGYVFLECAACGGTGKRSC